MRAALVAGILAMTSMAAAAKPPALPDGPFLLRLTTHFVPDTARQNDSVAGGPAEAAQPWQDARLGIRAEAVSDPLVNPRSGKHKTVMQYRLDGVRVFGGAVGGSLSGRGAVLTLHWSNGE
ncbi:MAG: hypothetical protein ACREHE_03910 [Rhizomicrobium sp.]